MHGFLVCAILLAVACKESRSGGDTRGAGSATAGSVVAGSRDPAGSGSSSGTVSAADAATDPGDRSTGSAAAAGVTRPKEVTELEAVLAALIGEPETEARSRKTCDQLMTLKRKGRAVARNKPAGVDTAAWDKANEEMANSVDRLGLDCGYEPPDDSTELPGLYKNFQQLLTLLPTGWELRSTPVELACAPPPPTGSYEDALDAGRVAGKAKRWADAVAAFERALAVKDGDAVALSELAWATLQVGDAQRALELAERAIAAATGPNAQAASHYNAARAAEALGDLSLARIHYEKSLELRPSDAIRARLAKLAPPPLRPLPQATPLASCQELASVDAACKCLATSVAEWGTAAGLEGAASCEPAQERGTEAQLVVVRSQPSNPEATAGGTALVLLAKRGAAWSAVQVVDSADDVELTDTPNAVHAASVVAYEQRAQPGGTAIWVQTQNQYSETGGGEREVRGETGLTLCSIPAAASQPASCSVRIPLAGWDYTASSVPGDDEDACQVRRAFAYRAVLTSVGALTLVLETGTDDTGRSGRYQR